MAAAGAGDEAAALRTSGTASATAIGDADEAHGREVADVVADVADLGGLQGVALQQVRDGGGFVDHVLVDSAMPSRGRGG